MMRYLLCFFPLLLALCGCSRKNPVSELSVSDSGVEVVEAESTVVGGWPGWRGPLGNGIAADQELPIEWGESKNVKWRSGIPGRGHSSPIIVGSTVYLATALDTQEQQIVLAFDRSDGAEKWQTVIHSGGFPSRGQVHQKATNANGTLKCDGVRLYTAFLNSETITATAIDLDGNLVWQREIGKFVSKFGYAPSPVLYKSLVIFAADNMGGGYLAALDSATGKVAWRVSRGDVSSYSSPTIANLGGRDQLLISGCGGVASYDPVDGSENWRTPCIAEATCGTVVTSSDRIYASGGHPDNETVCLSAEGEQMWSDKTRVYEPSMILLGERLLAINDDGIAFCWNAESGDQEWKKRLGGNFSASPIAVSGRVFVPNLNGETFVFTVDGEYEQLAKNRLGDDCYASPAAADGELYLRIGVGDGRDRKEELACIAGSE